MHNPNLLNLYDIRERVVRALFDSRYALYELTHRNRPRYGIIRRALTRAYLACDVKHGTDVLALVNFDIDRERDWTFRPGAVGAGHGAHTRSTHRPASYAVSKRERTLRVRVAFWGALASVLFLLLRILYGRS